MLNIYLDSALLAVPNYGTDADTVQELIDRVVHFSVILNEALPLQTILADNIDDILGIHYPTRQSILEFLSMVGLADVYSANDLLRQYQSILDRSRHPAEMSTFDITSMSDFVAFPALPASLGPRELVPETERVLATVAVQDDSEAAWWVASAMNGAAARQFRITATIISASKEMTPADEPIPFTFTRDVTAIERLCNLVDLEAARRIWRTANTDDDVYFAITLGALAIARLARPGATIADLVEFSIGSEFLSSLNRHSCGKTQRFSMTTFERCARIVADYATAGVQPMGRPRQTVRAKDDALACRSHITKKGLALRLMHWKLPSKIEFANVGVKKELRIEDGEGDWMCFIALDTLQ